MTEIHCSGCSYVVEDTEYRLPDGWVIGSRTINKGGRMTFGASTGWREIKESTITFWYCDECLGPN